MKVLDELELRQSLLLNYRETICVSNKPEDKWTCEHIDIGLDWLLFKISDVKKNKLYFYDNAELIFNDLESLDKEYAYAYEIK